MLHAKFTSLPLYNCRTALQLKKALPEHLYAKYDERVAEASMVGIENLVKCPFCSYAGTAVSLTQPSKLASGPS